MGTSKQKLQINVMKNNKKISFAIVRALNRNNLDKHLALTMISLILSHPIFAARSKTNKNITQQTESRTLQNVITLKSKSMVFVWMAGVTTSKIPKWKTT